MECNVTANAYPPFYRRPVSQNQPGNFSNSLPGKAVSFIEFKSQVTPARHHLINTRESSGFDQWGAQEALFLEILRRYDVPSTDRDNQD
jgi:hypothetical protein